MINSYPVIQKSSDLTLEILRRVAKFPKEYRFGIGDVIIRKAMEIQDDLIRTLFKTNKKQMLYDVNILLDQLRLLMRQSREVGALPNNGYEYVSKIVDELGKQIGGWIKKTNHG